MDIVSGKLQKYVNYFDKSFEYREVLDIAKKYPGVTVVPASVLKDSLFVKTDQSIAKLLQKAKLNEYAKRGLAKSTSTDIIQRTNLPNKFDWNNDKTYFFNLMRYQHLKQESERFKYLFNLFETQDDKGTNTQDTLKDVMAHIDSQPLYNAFKTHFWTYYMLLLEVEANTS